MKLTKVCLLFLLCMSAILCFTSTAQAGDMAPSAPPAATMKNLQTVEPRTPITTLPFTITNPGSYYLTTSISTSGGGITISASDVTIDLNGFALLGGSGDGITAGGLFYNLVVQNGIVRGWSEDGVDLSGTRNARIHNVSLHANQGHGMRSSWGALITQCVADGNYGNGIVAADGSKVDNCVSRYNGGDGVTIGIGGTIIGCAVTQNGGRGIYASGSSVVKNCSIQQNTGDGIEVNNACQVVENDCYGNGYNGDGAGIKATTYNRIIDNMAIGNDRGIEIVSHQNVIEGNVVKGNTDNYDIAGDNQLNILLCEVPETIDWPASVTFSGTLFYTNTEGFAVSVYSQGVTIDLSGHSLMGPGVGTGDSGGIYFNASGIQIYNGAINNFGGMGIQGVSPSYQLKNLRILGNGSKGMELGPSGLVQNCSVSNNGGIGIDTGDSSSIVGNVVANNQSSGIVSEDGSMVRENSVYDNEGTGIYVQIGCTVRDNVVYSNGNGGINALDSSEISNCTVRENMVYGIIASYGTISECTVVRNTGIGIQVNFGSVVFDNLCSVNKDSESNNGAGIRAQGGNRIEENQVTHNDRGIVITQNDNYVASNTVIGNTENYVISSNNNHLNLLLGEVPETIDWSAKVKFAGTLTSNEPDTSAITINADNVTIDLNGHALIGQGKSSGTAHGIYFENRKNVTIKDGTVRDFGGNGIYHSCSLDYGNTRIAHMHVESNGANGIRLDGVGSVVQACTSKYNSNHGLFIFYNSVIRDCAASHNSGNGLYAVSGCSILNSSSFQNTGAGIFAAWGCTIIGNTVYFNSKDGIGFNDSSASCLVDQNTATTNGSAGPEYSNIAACSNCTLGTNHAP